MSVSFCYGNVVPKEVEIYLECLSGIFSNNFTFIETVCPVAVKTLYVESFGRIGRDLTLYHHLPVVYHHLVGRFVHQFYQHPGNGVCRIVP